MTPRLIHSVPFTVTVDTAVNDAIALMEEHHVTYILIEENERLTGIVTASDVVRQVILGLVAQDAPIAHVMTHPVITWHSSRVEPIGEMYQLMRDRQIQQLPIVDDHHRVTGIVTLESLCAAVYTQPPASDCHDIASQLTDQQEDAGLPMANLAMAVELSGAGIWEFDPSAHHVTWNDNYSRLLGVEPNTVQPSYLLWQELIHPDDWQPLTDALHRAMETGDCTVEHRVQWPDGTVRWMLLRGCPKVSAFRHTQHLMGIAIDVTHRKRLEKALCLSEAKNRAILNAIPDLLTIYRRDGIFQEVIRESSSLKNLIDELPLSINPVGQHVSQIMPSHVATKKLEHIQQAIDTGNVQSYEQEVVIDDQVQHEDIRISPIDDETVLVMVRDIGERKHHEESLRQYERIFHATNDGMVLIDRQYHYQRANQTYLDWHHKSHDEMVGLHIRQVLGDEAFERSLKPNLDRCLQGETLQFEKWSEIGNPDRRYFGIQYSPYREHDGTIRGVVANLRDLTTLKHTTDALEKSKAENQAILEALPDLLIRVTYDGTIKRYVHSEFCDKSHHLYAQQHISEVLDETSTNIELQAIREAIDTHQLQIRELKIQKGNRQSHEEIRVARIDDHDALIIVRDITERKRVEEEQARSQQALKRQTRFLQSIIDAIPSSVFVKDEQGRFLLANAASAAIYAESPSSIIGKKDSDLNANACQVDEFLALNQHVMETRQTLMSDDQLICATQGNDRWYQTSISPLLDVNDAVIGVIGNCVDITERKTLELALKHSEAQLQTILSSIGAAVRYFRFFPNGQWETLYCSPKCADFFSGDESDGFTESWLSKIEQDTVEGGIRSVLDAIQREEQTCLEYRFRHVNGSVRWISDTLTSHWDDAEESWFVTAVAIDVSDRQRIEIERQVIEDALRKENQFRSQIIDQMADGLCVCYEIDDFPYLQFSVWNQRMTEITGYSLTEINANGWYQSLYADPAERARASERMTAIRQGHDLSDEEWVITRADGQRRTVAISTTVLDTDSRTPTVLSVVKDVSDRKQAEQQLQQSLQEKNLLLSEVHHRVNNNLQVIISLLNLQANRVTDAGAQQALKQGSDRVHAIALVHEKLYRTQHFEGIALSDYIRDFVEQLIQSQAQTDHPILSEYTLDDAIHLPLEKAIQVSLMLNEFVTNAIKHGKKGPDGNQYVFVELTQHPNQQVLLRIGNHSQPLPSEFSLTQPRTSMGLKLVQVLAEQIHGSIQVEPGAITWFSVLFDQSSATDA
jgi:PAS domain S-box-containing protein